MLNYALICTSCITGYTTLRIMDTQNWVLQIQMLCWVRDCYNAYSQPLSWTYPLIQQESMGLLPPTTVPNFIFTLISLTIQQYRILNDYGLQFHSWMEQWPSWQRFLKFNISPSMQMKDFYLQTGHDHFIPHILEGIIYKAPFNKSDATAADTVSLSNSNCSFQLGTHDHLLTSIDGSNICKRQLHNLEIHKWKLNHYAITL